MVVKISCPHGEYRAGMRIFCKKANTWCGNQYYKRCKGWWALNEHAENCPLRKEKNNGV